MKPRLLRSSLTGAVFVVTRYTEDDKGNIVAQTKHDVTGDFHRLVSALSDEELAFYRPPAEALLNADILDMDAS